LPRKRGDIYSPNKYMPPWGLRGGGGFVREEKKKKKN